MDASENQTSNPRIIAGARTITDIIQERVSRRSFLAGVGATAAFSSFGCAKDTSHTEKGNQASGQILDEFSFSEITRGADENHHIPDDYTLDLVLRWGDAIFPDAPVFDPLNQSVDAQLRQFGYNNDFIGYYPLEASDEKELRGLLCVNHEYTSTRLMFPGITQGRTPTKSECEVEMAAHGGTVVEVACDAEGLWRPVLTSKYNRRITAGYTLMEITGPAAGSERMKTKDDPTGRQVNGTMNNCAGGMTPWGTYLMAEENFNGNFSGSLPEDHPEAENHKRYGVPRGWYHWGQHFERFDVSKTPNEPNRYGWIVEVDILDPTSAPKKRTAMGRFKHEGAENVVAPDGRVVVYMGDDQRFDYVYKFVTARPINTEDRTANMDLLDEGTLYVAQFDADGGVTWLPLTFGEGPLTPQNGFQSQADILIEARRAADLLEATPMDRPEDVEPDPATGRVYVMLTNNTERTAEQVDAANPRANNADGQIIEIIEPNGDFTATKSQWEFVVQCGDPSDPENGSQWNEATSEHGWFGSPDNCAIDPKGRLWISTDGNQKTGSNDGLWALSTKGDARGTSRAFFRAPNGAEVCGPRFTPDGKTLFLAVQHPGDGKGASFEAPSTRWPDFEENTPPRPSLVAIRRKDHGEIG